MKMKIFVIGIIAILALIPSTLSISAQQVKSTNNSINITHNECKSNDLESAIVGGDVLGLIFDIQAYVICDGVDNDFHGECWESTILFKPGFEFSVPTPKDQDHYKVTAQKNGYKSKTVDVYLTPEDTIEYEDIILCPDLKSISKTAVSILFTFIRRILN